jgi:putative zinc finger/helix-turn-helix YgiT family protein
MATKQRQPKPFPHRCPECGAKEVFPEVITHNTSFKHEGRLYQFEAHGLAVNKCRRCGEVILTPQALDQIADAFHTHAGLLTTTEIAENIERLRLTQKEFAERIGVAQETVSRWVGNVQVQSRALDNLMRLFFKLREVRDFLARSA